MMNKTPSEIKALLDDLARLSLRHGIGIRGQNVELEELAEEWHGYTMWLGGQMYPASPGDVSELSQFEYDGVEFFSGKEVSFDPTKLSAHEKIEIIAGR